MTVSEEADTLARLMWQDDLLSAGAVRASLIARHRLDLARLVYECERCKFCGRWFAYRVGTGKLRLYCGGRCRTAAWRERKGRSPSVSHDHRMERMFSGEGRGGPWST